MISFLMGWLRRLDWKWYELRRGVRNVLRYAPVVWHDEDFDWSGLARVMEFKFREMARALEHGHCVDSEKLGRECLICAEHLKRLHEDDIAEPGTIPFYYHEAKMRGHERELGRRISRHLRHWWD